MIDDFRLLLRIYRDKLALLLLMLGLPWAWAFFWVPWWVNLICLALVPVAAAILIFRVLPMPPAPRRAEDDNNDQSDKQIRKMRKVSSGMNTLLGRWAHVSDQSRTSIEEVTSQVDEVIAYSESAVIEIGKKFVAVTRKTRMQVEQALTLLEQTQSPGEAARESRALPELVSAYGEVIGKINSSLGKVSESMEELERRHEAMRQDLTHIDTMLDQLSAHDGQIGVMALNTSVSAGTGTDVVSVSDQIRTLSLESKALTRDIRRTLEQIRNQAQHAHTATRRAVGQAKEVVQYADTEGAKLTRELLFNGQEVSETLSRIGALGGEIQKDINDIIVALQFQDITQQKLQRLKTPMLTDLMSSLRMIFDETRVLSNKLQGSGLVEGQAKPDGKPAAGTPAAPGTGGQPRKGDEAVEIF